MQALHKLSNGFLIAPIERPSLFARGDQQTHVSEEREVSRGRRRGNTEFLSDKVCTYTVTDEISVGLSGEVSRRILKVLQNGKADRTRHCTNGSKMFAAWFCNFAISHKCEIYRIAGVLATAVFCCKAATLHRRPAASAGIVRMVVVPRYRHLGRRGQVHSPGCRKIDSNLCND